MDIVYEIIKLKSDGLKINEIAEKLNIPVGTVKSKLFRNKSKTINIQVKKEEIIATNDIDKCKCCGKSIVIIKGKKVREFCSDYCRVKYWRKNKNVKKWFW